MANLTLTIDEELLRRARVRAARENTSVNAIVRDYLTTYAGISQMAQARRRLVELSRSSTSGSGRGGRSWSRDELHER
jgi:plasmid stability protein